MTNKNIITYAVASALALPSVALAATDSMGMQYVSASEGFSGSFRYNVFTDTDEENIDASTTFNSLRLYLSGSNDLGSGMKAHYYADLRASHGGLTTDSHKLGISGQFGSFWVGRQAGVADSFAPGGSLDTIMGSGSSGGNGTDESVIRYESPVINGLQLGASGLMNGSDTGNATPGGNNPEGSLDRFSIAAKYSLPIGLNLGLGYESKDRVASTNPASDPNKFDNYNSGETGFRFGATYSQDNWTVAYGYRKYTGHGAYAGDVTLDNAIVAANNDVLVRRENDETDYQMHRMAIKFVVDRVTMSANYSTETVSTDISSIEPTGTVRPNNLDLDRTTLGLDVAYQIGGKAWMAIGHKSTDTEEIASRITDAASAKVTSKKKGETLLWYRVDF